ncbi:MAG: hypothetical protein F6K47_18190, partial [Symploca sp. SIO2E6]|nr:hypothetical protein [Symploca sp. SIO2E6]
MGLKYFIADNKGNVEPSPQFYRQSERQLNRANRQKSRKFSSYLKKAKPEDVAQVVQAGANVLAEAVKEESVVLPAIAITAQEAGISFEEIIQSSVLDRPGRQLAELFCSGKLCPRRSVTKLPRVIDCHSFLLTLPPEQKTLPTQ